MAAVGLKEGKADFVDNEYIVELPFQSPDPFLATRRAPEPGISSVTLLGDLHGAQSTHSVDLVGVLPHDTSCLCR